MAEVRGEFPRQWVEFVDPAEPHQLIKADLKAALLAQPSVLAAAFEQQHGMPALVVSGVQRSGQSWIMPALGPEAATKMPPHFPYIQLPALLE